jgi:hypothetical protein
MPREFAVSAEGSVRFDFDISGLNETEAALAAFPKPDNWYLDLANERNIKDKRFTSFAALRALEAQLPK